jgi:CheY-like chemotaxis protein
MVLPGAENIHVLIVEDVSYIRTLLRGLLRQSGFTDIVEAAAVDEAIAEIRRSPPDLVFTDWEMPGKTGLDLLKWVRQDQNSPNPAVPIILLTSHSDPETIRLCRDAGANDFLVKPVSPKRVAERVRELIINDRSFVVSPDYIGPDRRRADRLTTVERRSRTLPDSVLVTAPTGGLAAKAQGDDDGLSGALYAIERIRAATRVRGRSAAGRKPGLEPKSTLEKVRDIAGQALEAADRLAEATRAMRDVVSDDALFHEEGAAEAMSQVMASLTSLLETSEVSELSMIKLHLRALRAIARERDSRESEEIAMNLAARIGAWRREQGRG